MALRWSRRSLAFNRRRQLDLFLSIFRRLLYYNYLPRLGSNQILTAYSANNFRVIPWPRATQLFLTGGKHKAPMSAVSYLTALAGSSASSHRCAGNARLGDVRDWPI